MTEERHNVGRLAMRQEGRWWVAYYAMPNTMDDAIEMGRIAMAIVENRERRQAFTDIMKAEIADFLEGKTGQRPDFQPAPESERSGNA